MNFGLLLVGEKGRYVLEHLIEKNHIPEFVVSYTDENMKDNVYQEIFALCLNKKISFLAKEDIDKLTLFKYVDKVFVIGWQFLIKNDLDKLVVIHDSKLPEYKGWSPTVNYLIEGSDWLGATAFKPTMKMDTGDIYAQVERTISYPLKIEDALVYVSEMYMDLITTILKNNPTPYEMIGEESFCVWRDYEDYFIDWNESSDRIKRVIDAVGYPFAGAKFKYQGHELTVIDAGVVDDIKIIDRRNHVGKFWSVVQGKPTIICGEGLLKLTKIIDENGEKWDFRKLKTRI